MPVEAVLKALEKHIGAIRQTQVPEHLRRRGVNGLSITTRPRGTFRVWLQRTWGPADMDTLEVRGTVTETGSLSLVRFGVSREHRPWIGTALFVVAGSGIWLLGGDGGLFLVGIGIVIAIISTARHNIVPRDDEAAYLLDLVADALGTLQRSGPDAD